MTEPVLVMTKSMIHDVLVTTKAAADAADDPEILEEATTYLNALTAVLDGRQATRAAVVLAVWSLLISVVHWAVGQNENSVQ